VSGLDFTPSCMMITVTGKLWWRWAGCAERLAATEAGWYSHTVPEAAGLLGVVRRAACASCAPRIAAHLW
jgi:hypothetical protein